MTVIHEAKVYTEAETFAIMDGLNDSYIDMDKQIQAIAPMCHFRKMFLDRSDSTDGHYEEWWECSVCGHTKDY